MLTRAERRALIRAERRDRLLLPPVVRRLTSGRPPQPRWLPRRLAAVVAYDLDAEAGVGAVELVWRPGSAKAENIGAFAERHGDRWQQSGGSGSSDGGLPGPRQPAGGPGQPGMIEVRSGGGMRSRADRREDPHRVDLARWVGTVDLRLAAEVDHVLVGERRLPVPDSGAMLVVWTSPPAHPHGIRPLIVARDRDGNELSRVGADDVIDTYTWRRLNEA